MLKIDFTKIVASGNDFVVIAPLRSPVIPLKRLAKIMCDRKYGIGADGMLFLEKSQIADVKMRIFNPDGSEAQMCGNGARCIVLWAKSTGNNVKQSTVKIETKAGIIESRVNGENVKIKLTEPKDLKLNLPIKVDNRTLQVNFINTGVPHTVIFVADLDKIDVINLGRQIRFHKRFAPQGTNVDFVEALTNKSIKIRTYERGVEDETSACGTGIVASSLIAYRLSLIAKIPVDVLTQSGEILKVYFKKTNNKFKNVWLEGKAKIVYKGCWCDE
jgi:diaminopimelate epimerase